MGGGRYSFLGAGEIFLVDEAYACKILRVLQAGPEDALAKPEWFDILSGKSRGKVPAEAKLIISIMGVIPLGGARKKAAESKIAFCRLLIADDIVDQVVDLAEA